MTETSLLVVGAGPYALATAAHAKARGIDTVVVGHPMGFWRDNMPAEMFLRSGPDWHLDARGVHTLEAFLEARGIASREVDPLPISLFLDYADWFRASQALEVREELVASLHAPDGRFEAVLEGGERVTAEAVVAAPGIRHFTNLPAWASSVPEPRRDHTWTSSGSTRWPAPGCSSWEDGRARTSGRRCSRSTGRHGWTWCTATTYRGSSG